MSRPADLIHTAEAAKLLGLALLTFRRRFCNAKAPLLPIVEHRGPRGVRRILVHRADVEALLESMTVRPQAGRQEPPAQALVQKPGEAPR